MSRWKYTPEERIDIFWSRVDKSDENACWLWKARRDKDGYGLMYWEDRRCLRAHRVSYILAYGEFDEHLCVLHRCDTPACVNPQHLFLGTQLDNAQDRDAKGRNRSGTLKLSFEQVVEIRSRASVGKFGIQMQLAREFHMSYSQIKDIVSGRKRRWK